MRRRRAALAILTLLGLIVACGPAPDPEVECSVDFGDAAEALRREYPGFRERVESGPFYRALQRRHRSTPACSGSAGASGLTLAYRFPGGEGLEASINPEIEFGEQRLTFGELSEDAALDLLRRTEQDLFGDERCGIDWDAPLESSEMELGLDLVFRGDTCNCQGRLTYRDGAPVALLFRSTC